MKLTQREVKEVSLFRKLSGILLILIGLVGIVVPIMPGWILVFIGLSLMGINFYYVEKMKEYAREKSKNAKIKRQARKDKRKMKKDENKKLQ